MAKANAAPQQLENLVKKQFKGGTDEPWCSGPAGAAGAVSAEKERAKDKLLIKD